MNVSTTLLLLVISALLEVGGDALFRSGMRQHRLVLMLLGAMALALYGYAVNAPPWDFGRLMGVYIALFFVISQLTSWLVFHQKPGGGILLGGAFIIAGGFIIAFTGPK